MSQETDPLIQKSPYKTFQNPITGSNEQLQQITDYNPISEDDHDVESLIGNLHVHDRDCRIPVLDEARRRLKKHIILYIVIPVYLTLVVLELFRVMVIPMGFIMSGLLLIGGTMGFLRKGSWASLFSGLVFGIVFAVAGYLEEELGTKVEFYCSIALTIVGAQRSYTTRFENSIPIMLFFLGLMSTGFYILKKYIPK